MVQTIPRLFFVFSIQKISEICNRCELQQFLCEKHEKTARAKNCTGNNERLLRVRFGRDWRSLVSLIPEVYPPGEALTPHTDRAGLKRSSLVQLPVRARFFRLFLHAENKKSATVAPPPRVGAGCAHLRATSGSPPKKTSLTRATRSPACLATTASHASSGAGSLFLILNKNR